MITSARVTQGVKFHELSVVKLALSLFCAVLSRNIVTRDLSLVNLFEMTKYSRSYTLDPISNLRGGENV